MNDDIPENLTDDLLMLLGEEAFLILVENYGGLRQYIPHDMEHSSITYVIGHDAMAKFQSRFCGDTLRIPLARRFRAVQYRLKGWSNRTIARKLNITESGVEKMFRCNPVKRPPRLSNIDPRQTDLFK